MRYKILEVTWPCPCPFLNTVGSCQDACQICCVELLAFNAHMYLRGHDWTIFGNMHAKFEVCRYGHGGKILHERCCPLVWLTGPAVHRQTQTHIWINCTLYLCGFSRWSYISWCCLSVFTHNSHFMCYHRIRGWHCHHAVSIVFVYMVSLLKGELNPENKMA